MKDTKDKIYLEKDVNGWNGAVRYMLLYGGPTRHNSGVTVPGRRPRQASDGSFLIGSGRIKIDHYKD